MMINNYECITHYFLFYLLEWLDHDMRGGGSSSELNPLSRLAILVGVVLQMRDDIARMHIISPSIIIQVRIRLYWNKLLEHQRGVKADAALVLSRCGG